MLDCLILRFGGKTAREEGKSEYAGEKVTAEQTLDDTLASAFLKKSTTVSTVFPYKAK